MKEIGLFLLSGLSMLHPAESSANRFPMNQGYTDGAEFHVERQLAPGITESFDSFSTGPLTINTAVIDGSRRDLQFEAEKAKDDMYSGEPIPEMVKRLADPAARPIVAMNADFWGDRHIPIGMLVDEGMIWKGPWRNMTVNVGEKTRSIFAFDDKGNYFIGLPRMDVALRGAKDQNLTIDRVNFHENSSYATIYTWPRGNETEPMRENQERIVLTMPGDEWLPNAPSPVTVTAVDDTHTTSALDRHTLVIHADKPIPEWIKPGAELSLDARFPDLPGKVIGVVGGGPRLVVDGVANPKEYATEESIGGAFVTDQHPRSAIGIKADGKTIVMAVVDGRQTTRSIGIDLIDLAAYMRSQGCVQAMNLDGGGSSTMVARDELLNFPSDGGARAVSVGLLVCRTAPLGPPDHLELQPGDARVPAGSSVEYHALVLDKDGEELPDQKIQLHLSGDGISSNSSAGTVSFAEPGVYTITASAKDSSGRELTGKSTVTVEKASSLAFEPAAILLDQGESEELVIRATNASGKPFYANIQPDQLEIPPFLSYDLATRKLTALHKGAGHLKLSAGGMTTTAPAAVGIYETETANSFDSLPADKSHEWLVLTKAKKGATDVTLDTTQKKEGTASWKLQYGMAKGGTSKISLPVKTKLPGNPVEVGIWIYGDGRGQWLRGELEDSRGSRFYIDFTDASKGIGWNDWKFLRASIAQAKPMSASSGTPTPPYTVNSIYLVQPQEAAKSDGVIWLDDLCSVDLPKDLRGEKP